MKNGATIMSNTLALTPKCYGAHCAQHRPLNAKP